MKIIRKIYYVRKETIKLIYKFSIKFKYKENIKKIKYKKILQKIKKNVYIFIEKKKYP